MEHQPTSDKDIPVNRGLQERYGLIMKLLKLLWGGVDLRWGFWYNTNLRCELHELHGFVQFFYIDCQYHNQCFLQTTNK